MNDNEEHDLIGEHIVHEISRVEVGVHIKLNEINKKLDHIRFGITLGFLMLALSVTVLWWVR